MFVRSASWKAACLSAGLIVVSGAACAHGTGGMGGGRSAPSHAGSGSSRAHPTGTTPSPSAPRTKAVSATADPAAPQGSGTRSSSADETATQTTTPAAPPSFAAECEGEVSANCEARAQSRFSATGGDPAPAWTAPAPTAIPPTPAAPAIAEPQASDTQNFEQSGGGSGVVITAGGGPTLADCMALWEPAVHMTKALWKDVCVRTMNGIYEPQVALGSVDPSYAASHGKPIRHVARK